MFARSKNDVFVPPAAHPEAVSGCLKKRVVGGSGGGLADFRHPLADFRHPLRPPLAISLHHRNVHTKKIPSPQGKKGSKNFGACGGLVFKGKKGSIFSAPAAGWLLKVKRGSKFFGACGGLGFKCKK